MSKHSCLIGYGCSVSCLAMRSERIQSAYNKNWLIWCDCFVQTALIFRQVSRFRFPFGAYEASQRRRWKWSLIQLPTNTYVRDFTVKFVFIFWSNYLMAECLKSSALRWAAMSLHWATHTACASRIIYTCMYLIAFHKLATKKTINDNIHALVFIRVSCFINDLHEFAIGIRVRVHLSWHSIYTVVIAVVGVFVKTEERNAS